MTLSPSTNKQMENIKDGLIRKLFKKETIAESAGITLIFTIIQKIIQTVRGVIFARLLGPSEYGVLTLAFIFIPFAVTVAKLGIASSFERYIPQYEKRGELNDFFRKNYLLTLASSGFFLILILLFSKQISELLYTSNQYKSIIVLCAFTILPYVLYENLISSFIGLRTFKMSSLVTFSQFLIFSVIGVVLVIIYPKAESTVLANLASFILIAFIFGFIFLKYVINSDSQRLKIKEDHFYKKIFKYSSWFIVTPLIFSLCSYTDRLLLSRFIGLRDVGVYSVAMNFTGFLFMFGVIGARVLLPTLSKIWEDNQKDKAIFILNFTTKFNALILLGVSVFLVLFKKPIILLLYGIEYIDGISVIGILSIFWIFNVIFWTIKGYGELIEKTYFPFIASTVGLPISVILNYLLIPRYNMIGAAVASTVTFGIILIIMFILNHKNGMEMEFRTILVCLLPLILILDGVTLMVISLILLGIIFKTDLIITKEERVLFFDQFQKALKFKIRQVQDTA